MPYNSKQMKVDGSGIKPVSQHFDTSIDDYDPVQGTDGASRVLIWDSTGHTPLFTKTNPGYLSLSGSNTGFNGTYTVTGTGAAIASSQACSAVLVQNDPNSNGYIYVGFSSAQTIALAPGASKEYRVSNIDMIYAKFGDATTATLNWEAIS